MVVNIFMDYSEEAWVTVPNYPDYDCSNMGRVRSRRNPKAKREGKPTMLTCRSVNGDYPRVRLCNDDGMRSVDVHVLVAELFIGPRPEGLVVCHEEDDRSDARASKLRYGTSADNTNDAYENGKQFKGYRHFSCKLTPEEVITIRADTRPPRVIAKEYGVSKPSILNIKKGITYFDVPKSPTVHLKKRKVIPKLRKFRENQIAGIKRDPRPYNVIASQYSCSSETIRCIKEGIVYKDVATNVDAVFNRKGKLKPDDVRAIRRDKRKHRIIAEEYGVSTSVITQIINRQSHKNILD